MTVNADTIHHRILFLREAASAMVLARGVDSSECMWVIHSAVGFAEAECQELHVRGVPVFRLTLRFEGFIFKTEILWLVEGYDTGESVH